MKRLLALFLALACAAMLLTPALAAPAVQPYLLHLPHSFAVLTKFLPDFCAIIMANAGALDVSLCVRYNNTMFVLRTILSHKYHSLR